MTVLGWPHCEASHLQSNEKTCGHCDISTVQHYARQGLLSRMSALYPSRGPSLYLSETLPLSNHNCTVDSSAIVYGNLSILVEHPLFLPKFT